jgi:hypothetical protein
MSSLADHQSSKFTKQQVDNFWRRVRADPDGCLLWTGYIDSHGYGRLGGKLAHNMAWVLAGRKLTPGKERCHDCANKHCVNVEHLFEGSHKENMQDAAAKGIMRGPRKLTDYDYEAMKELKKKGVLQKDIAKSFGISTALVSKFFNGGLRYAQPE